MPNYEVHLKPNANYNMMYVDKGEVVTVKGSSLDADGDLRITENNVTVAIFASGTWQYVLEVDA